MISIEKLNRLTDGQQRTLHESVRKFLEENLREVKGLHLIDDIILTEYMAKTVDVCKELSISESKTDLNDTLCALLTSAEQLTTGKETDTLACSLLHHVTLRYQQMKNVDECLNLIRAFQNRDIIVAEFAHIAGATTIIMLEDDIVYVDYSMPVTNQSWNLVRSLDELHIEVDGRQYVAATSDFYIESSKDDFGEEGRLTGRIRINRLSCSNFTNTGQEFIRCLIPVGSIDWNRDIRTYTAFIRNSGMLGLIELKDGDTLLHVYPCQDEDKKYMVVESLTETTIQQMAEDVYSVALTIGFITGTIHLGKCYEFSSPELEFGQGVVMSYHTMRPSSETGMKIFTTNMYYVRETLKSANVNLNAKTPLYNENGEFQAHLQDWLQPDMIQKLFNLIHGDKKVARAVVTLIESANFPLEYQASVRAIVLETLAHSEPGPKPIPCDELWTEMKAELESVIGKYENNADGERQISEEGLNVLQKKINSMNNPTNADSLARPLKEAGYSTTANDMEALKMRNTFLHGGLVKGSIEKQADELFYLSLMLHKLGCIIILKWAGFEGYILNNPVLFNCKKAVETGEPPLLKI